MNQIKILLLIGVFCLASCSKEDSLGESRLDTSTPERSELDQYIHDSYVKPYNIEVIYKQNEYEYDLDHFLYPPDIDSVKTALQVVKKIWIDSYTEAGGEDFIKEVAPRKLVFVGSQDVDPTTPTRRLGLAEGGKKITFFETNYLNTESEANVKLFISTIMHEYTHILNQTKPYDKQAWSQINPGDYTAAWYNETDAQSQNIGFLSAYSRLNVDEDFAEFLKIYLVDPEQYNSILQNASNEGQDKLEQKEAIVREYLRKQFDVDLDELRDDVQDNIQFVLDNY